MNELLGGILGSSFMGACMAFRERNFGDAGVYVFILLLDAAAIYLEFSK